MDRSARRLVYVLTAWEERSASSDRPAVWRFSLEDACARQRLGFHSLRDLTTFLAGQMAPVEPNGSTDETESAGSGPLERSA